MNGFGYVNQVLASGTYTLEVVVSSYTQGGSSPQNDFTARVYSADKMVLTDTAGKTSNDETIRFRTGGSINPTTNTQTTQTTTTTNPTTTNTKVRETTVTPTPQPQPDTETATLLSEMQALISKLSSSSSGFTLRSPKSYYQYALFNDRANKKFFFQLRTTTSWYNLDMTVQL